MSGFDIRQLKQDKEKNKGTWVECGGGLKIKIANPSQHVGYKEYMFKKSKSIRRGIDKGNADVEKLSKLQADSYAKFILKDWNLEEPDEEGNLQPVPCDEKTIRRIFSESPEFLDIVVQEATNPENFREVEEEPDEEDAKNS